MRGLAVLASILVLGIGAAGAATPAPTALTVTYWKDGSRLAEKTRWNLECDPATGTLARPAAACRRIKAAGWRLFAPVKEGSICTEIYGGPQVALVVGIVEGRRVWARVQRRNGCEIARWSRLSPWLLPPGGVT